jgi:hypothetical protein
MSRASSGRGWVRRYSSGNKQPPSYQASTWVGVLFAAAEGLKAYLRLLRPHSLVATASHARARHRLQAAHRRLEQGRQS